MQHAQRAERVPAARLADWLTEREGERLVVGVIEEPAAIGLLAALQEMQCIGEARIGLEIIWILPAGLNGGGSEVIQRAENVVVIAGREREVSGIRDSQPGR